MTDQDRNIVRAEDVFNFDPAEPDPPIDTYYQLPSWDEAIGRGLRVSGQPSLLIGIRDAELEALGLAWTGRPLFGLDDAE